MQALQIGRNVTAIVVLGATAFAAQVTTRASLGSNGVQGNLGSMAPSLSHDGRWIAFRSNASNLVTGDTNGVGDVFVRDLLSGAVARASVSSSGAEGNGISTDPALSRDGGTVAFRSRADNLVAGDGNAVDDIFVHDLATGSTTRVSVNSIGVEANLDSYEPALSADGRYVAFSSVATNLVPGVASGMSQVFVHDRASATTTCASVDANGAPGDSSSSYSSLSADGRLVAFRSVASNFVAGVLGDNVFVRDRAAGTIVCASVALTGSPPNGSGSEPWISDDGRFVAFVSNSSDLVANDTNGSNDIFVRDLGGGVTRRVSVDSLGNQGNGWCYPPSISGDGDRVQFHSEATNLVPGDTNGQVDCFVHELSSGVTRRVNVDSAGLAADGGSIYGAMSGDGRFVAFNSSATNLVPDDTNHAIDVFVHDLAPLQCGAGVFYCTQKASSQGCRALLSTSGVCSASAGSGFEIRADSIDTNRWGIFFYSTSGATSVPFQGVKLCVLAPFSRTTLQNSAGSATCDGAFHIDFNARIASGVDPALVASAQFWGQFWFRDPQSTATTGTTYAVTAIICP